jgi:glycosyltransferase involved in cell wall biosynthesis
MVLENRPAHLDTRVWPEATALRDQGFQVCIISPKERTSDAGYRCLDGIHLYSYSIPTLHNTSLAYLLEYGLSMLQTWWLSLRVLRRHGFDVIHAANPPDTFFFLHWFYRLLGKRFIFDQHDLSPELLQVKFSGRCTFLQPLLRWLEKRSYHAATCVLTTNVSQRKIAIERGQCDPARVFVVRNGPDLDRLYRVPVEPELKRGRSLLLVYLGAMEVQDGVEYALYALHELIYTIGYNDVFLAVLGDGSQLQALKQLAHALDLERYVHFTGWADDREIRRYLSTADIGLCPEPRNGLNEHCTMVKTMEYMALSLPIVAFDLQETRATCQETALYAAPDLVPDFARQIARLLDDARLRHAMGQRARALIEEHLSWDHQKRRLWQVYAMLFSARAWGSPSESALSPNLESL